MENVIMHVRIEHVLEALKTLVLKCAKIIKIGSGILIIWADKYSNIST